MKRTLFAMACVVISATMLLTACGAKAPAAAPASLTIWDGYHAGGSEEATITKLVNDYQVANPKIKITLLEVPFDQLYTKYETDTAAGGGPDMFTAPNDNLGSEVRAGLIAPIDSYLTGKLTNYTQADQRRNR